MNIDKILGMMEYILYNLDPKNGLSEKLTDRQLAILAAMNSRTGTLIWQLRNTHTERGSND